MGKSGVHNVILALGVAELPLGLLVTVVVAIAGFGDSLAILKTVTRKTPYGIRSRSGSA
jgi:hypothetical protein